MQKYEVLEKALAKLQKGWCKGLREDPDGNVCAIGAIELVIHGGVRDTTISAYALGDIYGLNEISVERYGVLSNFAPVSIQQVNDDFGKRAVEDIFREAIRREKAKAGVAVEIPQPTKEKVIV